MRPTRYYVYFSLALFFILAFCGEETFLYENPQLLNDEEFTFIPQSPKSDFEVSMVFYGCAYYQTTSVNINKKDISVRKEFNGAMKWPCVLAYDTISFGMLKAGDFNVTLKIIDSNPFAQDSVFYSETKTLSVR